MSTTKKILLAILAIAPLPFFAMYFYSFFQMLPDFAAMEELDGPPTEFLLHFGKLFVYIGIAGVLGLIGIVVYILDIVKNKKFQGANSNMQIVWILIVILLSNIGMIVYFIAEIIPRKANEDYNIPPVTNRTN